MARTSFGMSHLSIWLNAPKERTAAYFPTYSAIARVLQDALRQWVRDWFISHPEVLARPYTAQPILVYICTHPFRGKRTNTFTYEVQQDKMLDIAFASAASRLCAELKTLETEQLAWEIRQDRHEGIMENEQSVKDAKRYRLLRNSLLRSGFVIHQPIEQEAIPFVVDADFYGPTFEDAVDSLPEMPAILMEMPSRPI